MKRRCARGRSRGSRSMAVFVSICAPTTAGVRCVTTCLRARRWEGGVTGVTIQLSGLGRASRRGWCSALKLSMRRWKSRCFRPRVSATIVGTGNGRYRGALRWSAEADRCRAPCAGRSQRGFTMIEVLVALAIIAVALAASLRAVGSLANSEADLHQRLLAGWSADNALAQLRLTHSWPEVGSTQFRLLAGQSAVDLYGARDGDAESRVSSRGSVGDDAGPRRQSCADGDGGGE